MCRVQGRGRPREGERVGEMAPPVRGRGTRLGCRVKLSDSPVKVTPSPLLGEHAADVYRDLLGYDDARIAGLRDRGIV